MTEFGIAVVVSLPQTHFTKITGVFSKILKGKWANTPKQQKKVIVLFCGFYQRLGTTIGPNRKSTSVSHSPKLEKTSAFIYLEPHRILMHAPIRLREHNGEEKSEITHFDDRNDCRVWNSGNRAFHVEQRCILFIHWWRWSHGWNNRNREV